MSDAVSQTFDFALSQSFFSLSTRIAYLKPDVFKATRILSRSICGLAFLWLFFSYKAITDKSKRQNYSHESFVGQFQYGAAVKKKEENSKEECDDSAAVIIKTCHPPLSYSRFVLSMYRRSRLALSNPKTSRKCGSK